MTTFIDGWTSKPFPSLAFSAGGVLALADLHTIAQRTAIAGGASWFDVLVLAPGIHYQQAANELFHRGGATAIIEIIDELHPSSVRLQLNNAAIAHYIQKVAKPGETVTLDVGRAVAAKGLYKVRRSNTGSHVTAWRNREKPKSGWLSHALYLTTPVVTVASVSLVVIFKDWWSLISIMALMTSRLLNIWVIKQRACGSEPSHSGDPPQSPHPRTPDTAHLRGKSTGGGSSRPGRLSFSGTRQRLGNYIVRFTDFERKAIVRLRGKASDIREVTTRSWLRRKTQAEDYLEGAAKLIVYLVAALSGNMTQVGSMIMMVLLLTSAALLALSNAKADRVVVNGVSLEVSGSEPNPATPRIGTHATAGIISPPSREGGGHVVRVQGDDVGGNEGAAYTGRPKQSRRDATANNVLPSSGEGGRGGENILDIVERGQSVGHVHWQE
ncbi:hypothetical protein VTI28DRAFT_1189 [Corynascus sepedonium]